jgi:predicted MPP superfamily phosphohydrolase
MLRKGKLSRRDFLKLMKIGMFDLLLLALGVTGWAYLLEPGWVKVEPVNLKLKRLNKVFSGIRIAQISDIHMGGWMNAERLQRVVDMVLDQKPDLLILTGDFLIGRNFDENSEKLIQELIEILAPLAESIPSYAVLGNHDYWTNADAVRGMLKACNIVDLTNTIFTISREGESLHLCGVDDVWEGDVQLDSVLGQRARKVRRTPVKATS